MALKEVGKAPGSLLDKEASKADPGKSAVYFGQFP